MIKRENSMSGKKKVGKAAGKNKGNISPSTVLVE